MSASATHRLASAARALALGSVVACGDAAAPGGGDGGAGGASAAPSASSGVTTTSAAASSLSSTSASGLGGGGASGGGAPSAGGGGAGGAGDAGGAAGSGGAGVACEPPPRQVAAGDDFTCAVTEGGDAACRGGVFGNTWAPIELEPNQSASCIESVFAGRDVACVRSAEGQGCAIPGMYCQGAEDDGFRLRDDLGEATWVVVTDDDLCGFDVDGVATCAAGSASADLAEIAPLGGVAAGAHDTCAWGAGGLLCWGETPSVAADTPAFPGCPADVDVGRGFACVAYTGFDVIDCWGDLPRGISPRVFLPAPGADVAIGGHTVCVQTRAGLVRCWGDNATGSIGVPGVVVTSSPIEPAWPDAAPEVVAIAAGLGHMAARADDGAVFAWGANDASQVCDCADESAMSPVNTGFLAR